MVYVKSYNKNIWPGFISIQEDELFSSWYTRLVAEHKYKTHSFSKEYLNRKPIWNRDIDKSGDYELLKILYMHTPYSYMRLKEMFLFKYKYIISLNFNVNGQSDGILTLGIKHRKRGSFGLLYCPKCLKKTQYYKTRWRLITSIVCTECNSFLLDACPHCGSPIEFHRLEIGKKTNFLEYPLNICWNCLNELSDDSIIKNYSNPPQKYITYQNAIEDILNSKRSMQSQYSFQFFYVLFLLCYVFTSKSKFRKRIREAYYEYFMIKPQSQNYKYFNCERIYNRRDFLVNSFSLLDDWPNNFKKFQNKYKIHHSYFTSEFKHSPFWFDKEFFSI